MPRFEHDGISHYYTVAGAGFPLIFIHGLGLSHQYWIGQGSLFARHYTVISYDCRGHGGTGSSNGPISIRDLSEDLHALYQHLDIERAILIGYSSGTLICENFALDHPDKVAGLCLIGSYAKVDGFFMTLKSGFSKFMLKAHLNKMLAFSVAYTNAANVVQRGFFFRIAKRADPIEALRIMAASEHFHTTREIAKIECPVLLVRGAQDDATKPYAQALANQLPHAKTRVVEGVNHAVATRALKTFNAMLEEWLESIRVQSTVNDRG